MPAVDGSGSIATLEVCGVEVPWCSASVVAAVRGAIAPRPPGEAGSETSELTAPVVLIAGLGWRATGCVLSRYTEGLSIVALDYPRRWPRRPLDSMGALADLYATALQELALGPVHLLGVSLGGMVALRLALDHPQLVRTLGLVSTAAAASRISGTWRLPAARATAGLLPPESFHGLYRRWGPWLVGVALFAGRSEASRLWADPMGRRKMTDLLRAVARFDDRGRLDAVGAPTLVVHGARDAVIPPAAARELASGIRGARLTLLEQADHFAFLTHRARALGELERFWREEEGA